MGKWLLICAAGAVVGYVAVYFALDTKPAPQAEPEPPAAAATEPVALKDVVDVANVEALLDARPAEPAGVPFDAADTPEPTPTAAPAAIPMVDEFDQRGAAPPVDPDRAVWFGEHRLPRQIGGGRPADELWCELGKWAEAQRPVYMPGGFRVGVGCYF